jgi:predicted short-subunit dehydrogenase-like oxidoreductase (DUF2520 family)
MKEIKSLVILGSGNVATFLAIYFNKNGLQVKQIYSRNEVHAKELALKVNSTFTSDIDKLYSGADLYVFAVSDSAISSILEKRDWFGKFLVHTAGSVDLDIFSTYTSEYGILYPLQSFTKGRNFELSNVPICIEANNKVQLELLNVLAKQISENVLCIHSQQRAALHLAAVFASNFSNHMYSIAYELLAKNQLPVELLTPLIRETTNKALEILPKQAQTGPAIRNNTNIINKHTEMLSFNPDWQKIYTFATKSIIELSK